jgi:hypothetical protein
MSVDVTDGAGESAQSIGEHGPSCSGLDMKLWPASWPSDSRCASASGVCRVAPPRASRRGLPVVRERAIAAAGPDQMLVEVAHRVLEPDVSTR